MASNGIYAKDIKAGRLFTTRRLSDKGIRISKGSIVQHIMSTPIKDMTDRDYLFVAATEADKKNYGGFFAALTKYRNNVDQMYKMNMTAMNDLVSPSKKERVNTFIEIYKNDPVRVATQLVEFNKRNYAGQYKETVSQLIKKYSNMSTRQLKGIGYYTYANSWFDPEAGTLKDMRKKLEAKGYNAIIDDNDKRSFVQSQAPLIVFDVMNNLGETKVSKMTVSEIRRNMLDWQDMKHSEERGNDVLEELYHYGVKGMKWGVRKTAKRDARILANARRNSAVASARKKFIKGEIDYKTQRKQIREARAQKEQDLYSMNTRIKKSKTKDDALRVRNDISTKTLREVNHPTIQRGARKFAKILQVGVTVGVGLAGILSTGAATVASVAGSGIVASVASAAVPPLAGVAAGSLLVTSAVTYGGRKLAEWGLDKLA